MALPPGPAGGLERLLGYIDRPWKAIAVALLAVLGLVLYIAWEQRAQLAEAILQKTVLPRLETDRFPAIARSLMTATSADVAVLANVQFAANLVENVAGLSKSDPAWRPPSAPRVIFGADGVADELLRLLELHIVCGAASRTAPAMRRELTRLGIQQVCVAAVPPIIEVTLGTLMIGWQEPPMPDVESGARRAMERAALRLATW